MVINDVKNLSHLHVISISALCIDGKLVKISGPGFQVYEIAVCHLLSTTRVPSSGHKVTCEWICFKLSFLSSLNDQTLATKQARLYLSICDPLNSMSCLKQPTTISAGEIRETSWAATRCLLLLFIRWWRHKDVYSCIIGTITGWRDFCPQTAHPCFVAFIPHLLKFDFDQF